MGRNMIDNLVSTIIPVYNRAAMLREAVASVLVQTWRPIEIIIVDDGSSDETVHVAEDLQSLHPEITHVIRQKNAGPGVARQTGLAVAQGEFIQFLDSDDLLLPNKFEAQINGLRNESDASISYGKAYTFENGDRLPVPARRTGEKHVTLFPAIMHESLWPTLTPLYRHQFLKQIGPWPARKQLEDWEYDAQAGALNVRLHYVDEYIAETRNHSGERLCHLWVTSKEAMRDRIFAYMAVLEHAKKAGIVRESAEMQIFARSLFWMARKAGRYGLTKEAQQLFDLARNLSLMPGWDFKLFRMATKLLGWKISCRLAEAFLERRN